MRKLQLVGLIVLVSGLLTACAFGAIVGSGKSVSEERQVSGVSGVDMAFQGDLTITQGDEESLVITGDDNVLSTIDTDVERGVLRIEGPRNTVVQTVVPLRYVLTVKELDRIDMSGLGNISVDKLDADKLDLAFSGAGNVVIEQLLADELDATLSGLGNVTIAGEVNKQDVTLSGAGNYYADDLRSDVSTIIDSGLGNAELWVTEKLDATLSGAGSIAYYGKPEVEQTISGLGSIKGLGNK